MRTFRVVVEFHLHTTSPIDGDQNVLADIQEAMNASMRQLAANTWQRAVTPPHITMVSADDTIPTCR
jgi:hypothetical protein